MTLPELDWRRKPVAEIVEPGPHPAPEVPMRDATAEEVCIGARRVLKAALAAGWLARPTYARGTAIDRHGHPGALTCSLALRMALPGTRYRAVAVWTATAVSGPLKWTSDCAYAGLVGRLDSFRLISLTAGKKNPGALNLGAYLLDPSRLTEASTVSTVEVDQGRSQ